MTTPNQQLAKHLKEIKLGKRKIGDSLNVQVLK